jgi:hypothetical protein
METAASAAVEIATPAAVETTTSATAEVTASAAVEVTASESAEIPVSSTTEITAKWRPSIVAAAVITATVVTVSTASIKAMEPGAGADENSANEIIRAVVPVRRACIGEIAIVAVRACRRRTDIAWTDCDADSNLRMGRTCRQHENPKQNHIL